MNLHDAYTAAKHLANYGTVEQIKMASPPEDLESYIVLLRTPEMEIKQFGPEKWSLKDIRLTFAEPTE